MRPREDATVLSTQHIHPMLVHFPIVLVLLLATFDAVATLRGVPVTGRSAAGNASTGLAILLGISAIATYVFGDMALEYAEAGGFHSDIAEAHEGLGEAAAAAFAVWAILRAVAWWRNAQVRGAGAAGVALLEIAGAALVLTAAYLGGQLVYGLGVNVTMGAAGG
ncbi:MAG: hypothetical protein JNN33_08720 [Rhodospirillaceae bacterium]|jgi:uncharacterized membrane protein|nr:hypothetical protein [Rhodospirillaceae bacterium]